MTSALNCNLGRQENHLEKVAKEKAEEHDPEASLDYVMNQPQDGQLSPRKKKIQICLLCSNVSYLQAGRDSGDCFKTYFLVPCGIGNA